jgi:hypothetical protein
MRISVHGEQTCAILEGSLLSAQHATWQARRAKGRVVALRMPIPPRKSEVASKMSGFARHHRCEFDRAYLAGASESFTPRGSASVQKATRVALRPHDARCGQSWELAAFYGGQRIYQQAVRRQGVLKGDRGKTRPQVALTVRPAKAIAGEHPMDTVQLGGKSCQKPQGFADGSYDVALPQIVSRDIGFAQEHEALQRRMPRHRSVPNRRSGRIITRWLQSRAARA